MKKFVPIELDKTRNIRFGMVALMKVEKKLGKSFSKINFDEITYDEVANILWAGLVHEDPELTPDKLAELIDEYSNVQTAITLMGEAMTEAFGKNDQGAVQ